MILPRFRSILPASRLPSSLDRRRWLRSTGGALAAAAAVPARGAAPSPLLITDIKVTPIALPDPPLLAASGCHGPYFLRNVLEIRTDAGIVGIGETRAGAHLTGALEKAREMLVGQNAFAYQKFSGPVRRLHRDAYAAVELACLDACGQATGRRLCELLGGPVREEVEFAAYLFYRYAADHPKVLADPRLVDDRGRGDSALDTFGEVRTPEAMAELAAEFKKRFGFRVFKLKAGVFPPDEELAALRGINAQFAGKSPLRIDPNARWKVPTALRIAKAMEGMPLEYYEDPVRGQEAMAEVRRRCRLVMSTNMCVTRFEHIPPAVKLEPIDVVLGDHHGWGGITALLALGRLCEVLGWGLSQHSNNHAGVTMAAMIHAAATVPQMTLASDTHYPWLAAGADVIEGDNLEIAGGRMQVPEAPGIGVKLDPDKLARAHETYQKCGMRSRDDAQTMRIMQPGWQRKLF